MIYGLFLPVPDAQGHVFVSPVGHPLGPGRRWYQPAQFGLLVASGRRAVNNSGVFLLLFLIRLHALRPSTLSYRSVTKNCT